MRSWIRASAPALLVMTATAGIALAGPGGHAGGGGGGGGGGHYAGGFHSGAAGGWHGGGAWRGGWHGGPGWRGGYYGYGWCCGWGWGIGFSLPLLPWYYDTYWWGGVPYYYADGSYYRWNGGTGEYESVEPPAQLSPVPPAGSTLGPGSSVNPPLSSELFAYPKGGQSEAQQKQDKDECRRWATSQSGFSPGTPAAAGKELGEARQGYLRAQAACLEARNYSVR